MNEEKFSYRKEYRAELVLPITHIIDGKEYIAPPIKKENIVRDLKELLPDQISSKDDLKTTLNTVFDYFLDHAELYCGVNRLGDQNLKEEAIQSKNELIDIFFELTSDKKNINISEPLKQIFDSDFNPSINKIIQNTWRAFEAARQCGACDQTGKPEIGGLMHLTAVLLSSYLKENHSEYLKWGQKPEDSIKESANPDIFGCVDGVIAATRDNKSKYPTFDKFCSTPVDEIDGVKGCCYYTFAEYIPSAIKPA